MKYRCATITERHRCGFTLVEPAIGIAIIVVLIIAFYGGISHAIHLTRLARENQRASQILLEKSEVVRMCRWQQLTNGYVPAQFTNTYSPGSSHGVTYYGTIAIANAPVNAAYTNNLKAVTVSVRWNSGGLQRSREMKTLVSQWGLNNYVN